MRSRLIYLIPLAVFAFLAIYFAIGLTRDPKLIPSALINHPAPQFNLPPIEGTNTPGVSTADLKKGEISVVNFFASWCVPCRAEHPEINKLASLGIVKIYGINYKDEPAKARAWLEALGDHYTATGADTTGRTGIDFGVYGVPETFIIDGTGQIRYKHVGPIVGDSLQKDILPVIRKLSGKP